ncbi:MAG: PD40 domain-containing protein [Bacteroidetes bacterium]|nr:PD40 domain-containing protein [Bacteroidota bacterium]
MKHITRLSFILLATVVFAGCSSAPPDYIRTYPVRISNIGAAVNTEEDEFAPSITANGLRMVYTRGNSSPPFVRDFWESTLEGDFWRRPSPVSGRLNSLANEGSPSISADGQVLFFAAADRSDNIGKSDIYRAELIGKEWGPGENLGYPVNTGDWESHPSISPDGSVLYFVSDRDGGFGGLDLWMTERTSDGSWMTPINLGAMINTDEDEVSPYIASDGSTLYFASEGHPGLGGTDMFVSRRLANGWSEPVNLGIPLNSEDNDEFFTLAAEGDIVYFSSEREDGFGGYDLYHAEPNPFPPGAVVVLSGTVRERRTRDPLSARLTLRDASTGEELSVHSSNAYSGEYIIVLPAGAVYEVTASSGDYDPVTERFDLLTTSVYGEITHDFLLGADAPPGALAASIRADVLDFSLLRGTSTTAGLTIEEIVTRETVPLLTYVFFDENATDIPNRYTVFDADEAKRFTLSDLPNGTLERYHHLLNIIALRMRQRPAATLRLTGTTDGRESRSVAQKRAENVASYLTDVWGIASSRVSIDARGLPESPSTSRSEQGRAENRRVELHSSDADLLAPIESTEVERMCKPETVHFYPSITAESGLARWTFAVSDGERVLRDSDGYTQYPDSIGWNWRDPRGELPQGDTLLFTLTARDESGNEVRTEPQTIPVNVLTLERKNVEQLPDRTLEKISLILFDYDRSDLGGVNRYILRSAAERLSPRSTFIVRGYTDAMGEADYNQKLSERRAASVHDLLREFLPNAAIRSEGVGESQLLFDNTLPEGRFYCRTVQILVETIK